MKNLALLISFLILVGCNSVNKEKLIGVWKLSNIEDPQLTKVSKSLDMDFPEVMDRLTEQIFFSYINFETNDTFTFFTNNLYITGKWDFDKKSNSVVLTFMDKNKKYTVKYLIKKFIKNKSIVLNFKFLNDSSFRSKVNKNNSSFFNSVNLNLYFEKDNFKYKNKKQNIYSYENNAWRIKPLKSETPDQTKDRLKKNIQYMITYLGDPKLRKENKLDIKPLLSPITIGGNGIALKDIADLPEEWYDIFYNDMQALDAYRILQLAFTKDYDINENPNWAELDADLLQQIYLKL